MCIGVEERQLILAIHAILYHYMAQVSARWLLALIPENKLRLETNAMR